MEHILNINTQQEDLFELFNSIAKRNTILFIGAGASIDKGKGFLAKTLIEFFQDHKHVNLQTEDLKTFVDIIEANEKYSRDEFDEYVDNCLRNISLNDGHRIVATLPWRQIISTNMDLLVEKAFDELENTSSEYLKLKTIRSKSELLYQCSHDELKHIKLNGCISSKKEYPLVFSTSDFSNSNSYYKSVLNELRNPSDKIRFLWAGYSFTDPWAKYLFDLMEEFNYRENRYLYCIDPYIPESILPLYADRKIRVIKASYIEFFNKYKDWEETNNISYLQSIKTKFTTANHSDISLKTRILLRLSNKIEQLSPSTKARHISKKEFYSGEEPNYIVISKNFDIIRESTLQSTKDKIINILNSEVNLIPIIFLTGSFGTGKSTFAYRLIYNILNDSAFNSTVAYEVFDSSNLNSNDLADLFTSSRSKNILLYFNSIEVDYVFKSLLEFRNRLSIHQLTEHNILIISTIRENILEKKQIEKEISNSNIFNIDTALNNEESKQLVRNLKECGLINYRDKQEENSIVQQIYKKFGADSFITLLNLVTNGSHIYHLLDAYNQLSKEAKIAFIYTSLTYQFNILMPASILRKLISKDWQEFRQKVIKVEGKGILIQENVDSNATDPDLYFKTKHPLISSYLIGQILKPQEVYKHYSKLMNSLNASNSSSLFASNLLKSIRINNNATQTQLNKLYDLAYNNLNDIPHFLLHYSINLQFRRDIIELTKAEKLLQYAESQTNRRDSKITHRRGVINFEISKHWYKNESDPIKAMQYFESARELFEIKKIIDPCSSYSYYDLINIEIWYLKNIETTEEEELQIRVKIEENFDLAERAVLDFKNRIFELKEIYKREFVFKDNEEKYIDFLENTYENEELKPYALILLFNYYLGKEDYEKCSSYLFELELHKDINDVARLLFKFYGRNSHTIEYRIRFFKLMKEFPEIEDVDSLRYNYFNFIAEAYNKNFKVAFEFCHNISDRFNYLNPIFQLPWRDSVSSANEVFKGTIRKDKRGNKVLFVPSLRKYFYLIRKKNEYIFEKEYAANLFFFLNGIRAEIISSE